MRTTSLLLLLVLASVAVAVAAEPRSDYQGIISRGPLSSASPETLRLEEMARSRYAYFAPGSSQCSAPRFQAQYRRDQEAARRQAAREKQAASHNQPAH